MAGAWAARAIDKLREPDVGNAGGVFTNQVDVRVEDGGVDGLTVLRQDWERRVQIVYGCIIVV